MSNGSSRRRTERIRVELPVKWRRGDREIEATTGDISMEGVFLRVPSPGPLFPGALMQLEVALPAQPPLQMFVSAVFVGQTHSGAGIGAQIFVIGDEEKRRWRRYYRTLLRDHHVAGAA